MNKSSYFTITKILAACMILLLIVGYGCSNSDEESALMTPGVFGLESDDDDSTTSDQYPDYSDTDSSDSQNNDSTADDSSTDDMSDLDPCSVRKKMEFVYQVMTDSYLWYDKVPTNIDISKYDSPEALLERLKYSRYDHWSFIMSKNEYYDYFEAGKYVGAGFQLSYDLDDNVRIAFVYGDSPAQRAGLKRGDKIVAINGKTIAQIENEQLWETILGADDVGIAVELTVEDADGNSQSFSLTKDWVNINTVLHQEVIDLEGHRIGYLVFMSFLDTSTAELDNAFTTFVNSGVTDLILDLRYNSGGLVEVAQHLASLIGGQSVKGKVFGSVVHNDKYSDYDSDIYFTEPFAALSLGRLFVITTETTCSASELVINSLKPFIDVKVIGSTTCGKPVGMYGHEFCDIVLNPIEYKIVNANGEGDYFGGILADCPAKDDMTRDLGDQEEDSLKKAINYVVSGQCGGAEAGKRRTAARIAGKKKIPMSAKRLEIGAF